MNKKFLSFPRYFLFCVKISFLSSFVHGHDLQVRESPISHISFGVTNLEQAITFYDVALASLGLIRLWTVADGAGYGLPGGNDILALKAQPNPVNPPGPGFHLAFTAPTHEAVDTFHATALKVGGRDNGGPGLRLQYSPTYYAAFVIDPEGYNLEAVCQEEATIDPSRKNN